MAVTADLPGGTYCGPNGLSEMSWSPAGFTTSTALSRDPAALGAELWKISERTTGIR